jgi:hypothetical protein
MQRLRYVTNRLLYLLPFSEIRLLEIAIYQFPEFRETMALLELLIRRNISPLLEMPGPAVGAASSLLDASGSTWDPVALPNRLSRAGIQSASVFLLYGVAVLPAGAMAEMSPQDRELLLFCAGKPATQREIGETGYIDELRTLQINQPLSDRKRLLNERYSVSETSEFEALDIGEDHFS